MNPGSIVDGIARCGEPKCNTRITLAAKRTDFDEAFANKAMQIECDTCKEQRASRKLVADDENDERFREERFLTSPAVFRTNDSKYDVNKQTFIALRSFTE